VGAAGGTRKGSRPEGISNGIYGQGINGACEITKLDKGRWPANIVHDGSPEVVAGFPVTNRAARFFYTAKASRVERERGLSHREPETVGDGRHTSNDTAYQRGKSERRNIHPTVKPVSVMRWLVRLVTPPNGVVLDPYTGSGTTGIACVLEGFDFLGCELSPEYCAIAESRIAHAKEHPKEWDATHGDPTQTKLF
jgi:site-specific DNA-methyltransferase (adenine-specific)